MSALAPALTRPASPPSGVAASLQIALRVLRKYFRTPGLFVMGMVQATLFLFCFRYVFGGAVEVGGLAYAQYLVPGYVATIVLFTGGGIAVDVAEERAQGLTDRLRSLPIARGALVAGRTLADSLTNWWSIVFTAGVGFAFGFRLPASAGDGLEALALCLAYGVVFTSLFIVIGLVAPTPQAAQGMSMIAFVLAFFSSTYVPVATMPGWLQPFAANQPITPMVDAVRNLLVGSTADVGLALAWSLGLVAVFAPFAARRYRRSG